MRLRDAARVVHVDGNVRFRAAQVDRHAHGAFRVGDSLHPVNNVLPAPLKFVLELRDQRFAVLAIRFVKRAARDDGHARGNHAHRQQQRERENPEKLGAKRHCDSCSSQTSASGQPSPASGAFQSLHARTQSIHPRQPHERHHTIAAHDRPFPVVNLLGRRSGGQRSCLQPRHRREARTRESHERIARPRRLHPQPHQPHVVICWRCRRARDWLGRKRDSRIARVHRDSLRDRLLE